MVPGKRTRCHFQEDGKGAPGAAASFESMRRRYLYTRSAAHERQVNKVKVWVWVL